MVTRTSPRVRQLLAILDRAYDRRSWHGTNLRGAIRGLDVATVSWRPGPARHNIWELVVHAAYWKYTVWRRLTGEKRGSFTLAGSNWFVRPLPGDASEAAWRADVTRLADTHAQLIDAVSTLEDRVLDRIDRGSSVNGFELIAGIAAHDLYHAGQIQLLKRLAQDRAQSAAADVAATQPRVVSARRTKAKPSKVPSTSA